MPANHAETKVSFSLPILPISRSNGIKAQPLVETVFLDRSGLVPMWAILSGVFDIFRTSTSLSNLLLSVGMDSIHVCPNIVLARLRHQSKLATRPLHYIPRTQELVVTATHIAPSRWSQSTIYSIFLSKLRDCALPIQHRLSI